MLRWAIPYDQLSEEDPPVTAYSAARGDNEEEPLPIEGTGPQAESVSNFVLAVVDEYKPNGGRFDTWLRDDLEVRRRLDAFFPIRVAHHRTDYWAGTSIVRTVFRPQGTIYEGNGILSWLHASHRGFSLEVCAHSSLPRKTIPEFLWEYARREPYPAGIFRTDAVAEQGGVGGRPQE
jgi:hypothetical protein